VMMWEERVQVNGQAQLFVASAVPASNPHHVAHGLILGALVQQNAFARLDCLIAAKDTGVALDVDLF
jgi:hypothetical protein